MKTALIVISIIIIIACILIFVKGTVNINGKEEKVPLFQVLLNKTIYKDSYKTYTY